MASRRDTPRARAAPASASASETTPTVYPPESGAKARAPERHAPTEGEKPSRAGSVQTEPRKAPGTDVSLEERYRMIAEAAYLRAERRGFEPGREVEDWLAAEGEVDRLLGGTKSARRQ
jgi:hypothetical protein